MQIISRLHSLSSLIADDVSSLWQYVRVDGEVKEIVHGMKLDRYKNHDIEVVIDKIVVTEKTSWEEAKADILGLFMVTKLIEMGEITNITAFRLRKAAFSSSIIKVFISKAE